MRTRGLQFDYPDGRAAVVLEADMPGEPAPRRGKFASWTAVFAHWFGKRPYTPVQVEIDEFDYRYLRRIHLRRSSKYTDWPHYMLADVAGCLRIRRAAGRRP